MTEQKTSAKAGRPSRTLKEEIAVTEQRLQQLKAKQREEERRELEKNQKAIMVLLKSEGLDEVSLEKWQTNLPKLVELLTSEARVKPKAASHGHAVRLDHDPTAAESGDSLAGA